MEGLPPEYLPSNLFELALVDAEYPQLGGFEVAPSFAHLTPAVKTYDEHPWPLHQRKNHSIPPISRSPNTKCSFCIPSKVDVDAHYGSFAICTEFVQIATSTVLTIMPGQKLSFLAIRHVSTHGRWKFSNAGSYQNIQE